MSYTGTGSQDDVLKVGAGGGIVFGPISTTTTVASGTAFNADYTTVKDALDAGATAISIVGYTVESSGLTAPEPCIIKLEDGANWNIGPNTLSSSYSVDINGNGVISYTSSDGSAPMSCPVTINGLSIENLSTIYAPISDGSSYKVTNCSIIGDCVIDGSRGMLSTIDVTGSLLVLSSATGCNIQHANITSLVVDSGVNTVMSNIRFG